MKSFRITKDGDLDLVGGSYATVTGADKLVQDLSVALRERYQSDRFHLRWGSLLDSYIGSPQTPLTETTVKAEIQRVVGNYMVLQRATIDRVITQGKRPPYDTGEVIARIVGIDTRLSEDRIYVTVKIETLSREQVVLFGNLSLLSGNLEIR